MGGLFVTDSTSLDRAWFSNNRCDNNCGRQSQLIIDSQPHNKRHGYYYRFCWQCYWGRDEWQRGPIVNCGPAWDEVDVRRGLNQRLADSSPS